MENKTIISERNTQIVMNRKITILEGDKIELTHIKEVESKNIVSANLNVNGNFLGRFDLDELEDFLSLFSKS